MRAIIGFFELVAAEIKEASVSPAVPPHEDRLKAGHLQLIGNNTALVVPGDEDHIRRVRGGLSDLFRIALLAGLIFDLDRDFPAEGLEVLPLV